MIPPKHKQHVTPEVNMQDEAERLFEERKHLKYPPASLEEIARDEFIAGYRAGEKSLRVQNSFEELKARVLKHREAYGLEFFPNSETLTDDSSRDSISAKMGRHMCDCFIMYIEHALAAFDEKDGE